MIDKEQFYEIMKPYIERGIAKEMYSDDKMIIYNMMDTLYAGFLYFCLNNRVHGFLFDAGEAGSLVRNMKPLEEMYTTKEAEGRYISLGHNNIDGYEEYFKLMKSRGYSTNEYIDQLLMDKSNKKVR